MIYILIPLTWAAIRNLLQNVHELAQGDFYMGRDIAIKNKFGLNFRTIQGIGHDLVGFQSTTVTVIKFNNFKVLWLSS